MDKGLNVLKFFQMRELKVHKRCYSLYLQEISPDQVYDWHLGNLTPVKIMAQLEITELTFRVQVLCLSE